MRTIVAACVENKFSSPRASVVSASLAKHRCVSGSLAIFSYISYVFTSQVVSSRYSRTSRLYAELQRRTCFNHAAVIVCGKFEDN